MCSIQLTWRTCCPRCADALLAGAGGGLGLAEVYAGLPPRPLRAPAAGSLGPAADRAEHLGYPPTQEVGSFIYLGAAACLETHVCRYNVGIQVMAMLVVAINVFTTGFY